jgi:dihydrofolate reductase
MSIDGFIAGPNGETDWMIRNWDGELKKYVYNLTQPADCIVIGKNLARHFIDHWQESHKENSGDIFARKMVDTPKMVFSRTLNTISWKNTKLVKGEISEEIQRLKKMKGKDIIAYGGVAFLSSLIKTGLVDEYNLFINPVLLGDGQSIFRNTDFARLNLVYSSSFDCGVTALCYTGDAYNQNKEENLTWSTNSLAKE